MLGEAIRSLPLTVSVTHRTIGLCQGAPDAKRRSTPINDGHQALRDASLSPLAQRAPDARAQGARVQGDLAPARAVAGTATDARVPRRNRPGDEVGGPAAAELPRDFAGSGGGEARAAPLSLRPRAAARGGGGGALGR